MVEKVFILVGMIASGKSTYSKNAAKQGLIIVSDDSIVNGVHADEYTLYDKKLKLLYKSIENQIASLGLALGRSVVIDRGLNTSINGRKRWLALANSFDVPCEAICFLNEGPETHARRRVNGDNRGWDYDYWLKAATRHHNSFELPTLNEGFSLIHHISFEDIQKGKVFL